MAGFTLDDLLHPTRSHLIPGEVYDFVDFKPVQEEIKLPETFDISSDEICVHEVLQEFRKYLLEELPTYDEFLLKVQDDYQIEEDIESILLDEFNHVAKTFNDTFKVLREMDCCLFDKIEKANKMFTDKDLWLTTRIVTEITKLKKP